MKLLKILRNKIAIKIYYILPNYPNSSFLYKYFEFYRRFIHKKRFNAIGINSYLRSNVKFYGEIRIGSNCIIGPDSILNSGEASIEIGDYFLGGPQMIIYASEHGIENNSLPFCKQKNTFSKVIIGDNVYVGARVIILKGTEIGNNVIIAAGSVVRGKLKDNAIYGGVPVKKIKDI